MFESETYLWKRGINYKEHPEDYRVGRGEQGVLICEPYKSELVCHWRFKTPEIAQKSAAIIYKKFLTYLLHKDFVGADMARKFLQMGFTRARRYYNYKGGRKYGIDHMLNAKGQGDHEKAECALLFYDKWQMAESNELYAQLKTMWKDVYG